jgi:hypothetical protein
LRIEFALHAVNLLGLERDVVEERLAGHAEVAFGVVGWDGAFVDPEEVEVIPGHAPAPGLVGVGEERKGGFGGGTAADGDAGAAMGGDGFPGHLDKILSGAARSGCRIRLDIVFDAELSGHTR